MSGAEGGGIFLGYGVYALILGKGALEVYEKVRAYRRERSEQREFRLRESVGVVRVDGKTGETAGVEVAASSTTTSTRKSSRRGPSALDTSLTLAFTPAVTILTLCLIAAEGREAKRNSDSAIVATDAAAEAIDAAMVAAQEAKTAAQHATEAADAAIVANAASLDAVDAAVVAAAQAKLATAANEADLAKVEAIQGAELVGIGDKVQGRLMTEMSLMAAHRAEAVQTQMQKDNESARAQLKASVDDARGSAVAARESATAAAASYRATAHLLETQRVEVAPPPPAPPVLPLAAQAGDAARP